MESSFAYCWKKGNKKLCWNGDNSDIYIYSFPGCNSKQNLNLEILFQNTWHLYNVLFKNSRRRSSCKKKKWPDELDVGLKPPPPGEKPPPRRKAPPPPPPPPHINPSYCFLENIFKNICTLHYLNMYKCIVKLHFS